MNEAGGLAVGQEGLPLDLGRTLQVGHGIPAAGLGSKDERGQGHEGHCHSEGTGKGSPVHGCLHP